MSNRFLGEVDIPAGGRTWRLRIDFNAMAEFEDATGKEALKAFEDLEKDGISVREMRLIVHLCMLRYHPDATLRDAGDLLSENPGAVSELMTAAMPTAADAVAAGVDSSGNATRGAGA